jgi:hypothetical protein
MSTDATITRNHAYRDSGFSSLSIRLLPSLFGTIHGGKNVRCHLVCEKREQPGQGGLSGTKRPVKPGSIRG